MTLYEAIDQMRRLTEDGQKFSMSYMSCNLTTGSSHGIVDVRHAQLRKRRRGNDELMEYYDFDTNEDRRFYAPLLIRFNGKEVDLR